MFPIKSYTHPLTPILAKSKKGEKNGHAYPYTTITRWLKLIIN